MERPLGTGVPVVQPTGFGPCASPDAHPALRSPQHQYDHQVSAAESIARALRGRVPGWKETSDRPGLWRWTDPDPDYSGRYVELNGTNRWYVPVAAELMGKHTGPQLTGSSRQVVVVVVLPHLIDGTDIASALAAMEAIDALPAPPAGPSSSGGRALL